MEAVASFDNQLVPLAPLPMCVGLESRKHRVASLSSVVNDVRAALTELPDTPYT